MNFIELLLDFIEAMNVGVVFARRYTILKDRDITGELKEVWNAVLAIRENEQRPQQETWIDAQPALPAMPQYPQYMEQQAQMQQQPQPSLPEFGVSPLQYHSSIPYGRGMSGDANMHYESYGHQQPQIVPKNEPIFATGPQIMSQQTYHSVVAQQLGYNVRDISREADILMQKIITAQQQSRMTWPQLPHVPNMRPNPYGPANTSPPAPPINLSNTIKPYQPYIPYHQQQQQQQPPPPPPPPSHIDNAMHVDVRRLQQQPTPPPPPPPHQMHLNHAQPYEQSGKPFNVQPNNAHRQPGRPHMGVAQKNNATRRQTNSPTHNSSCQTWWEDFLSSQSAKPKSPVKVLQREQTTAERHDANNHADSGKATPAEKGEEEEEEEKEQPKKSVPVTDLDENSKKKEGECAAMRKDDANTSEAARVVDNSPAREEKPVKVEKSSQETKETEAPAVTQQQTQQPGPRNPNRFGKGGGRTRGRGPGGNKGGDKGGHNASEKRPQQQQTMMNNIIKNVFKIGPGGSGEEMSTGKLRKTNGQAKVANGKATYSGSSSSSSENSEEQQPGYTILKKDAQENVVSEIAQLSIQDCKDATEIVGPVMLS